MIIIKWTLTPEARERKKRTLHRPPRRKGREKRQNGERKHRKEERKKKREVRTAWFPTENVFFTKRMCSLLVNVFSVQKKRRREKYAQPTTMLSGKRIYSGKRTYSSKRTHSLRDTHRPPPDGGGWVRDSVESEVDTLGSWYTKKKIWHVRAQVPLLDKSQYR